jgi:hypothetical protein
MASPVCVSYSYTQSQLTTPEHRTQGLTLAKSLLLSRLIASDCLAPRTANVTASEYLAKPIIPYIPRVRGGSFGIIVDGE